MCFAAALVVFLALLVVACGAPDDEPSTRVSNVRLFDISSPRGVRCVVAESRYDDAGIAMSCDWGR
jgi:hypothetical protein